MSSGEGSELFRAVPDGASCALHKDSPALHGTGNVDSTVCRDTRDSETRSQREGDPVR